MKLMAGPKLRKQAIERTKYHIRAHTFGKSQLGRILQQSTDNLTMKEYLEMEAERLEQMRLLGK